MLPYALTIFTGAFLLFQVQPLIGKYILPWFGGGPGVWTTCMLFFQIVLLGGYAYAHLVTKLLKPRGQVILHLALLAASLAVQPIMPSESWKPTGTEEPVGRILLLLTVTLGLPYFVLSSTGPLMQQWFSRSNTGVSPYRLYALSNIGSLLALLSYPFFFEIHLTRRQQAYAWGLGMAAYALFCGWCAFQLWKKAGENAAEETPDPSHEELPESRPTFGQRLLWLLLPFCASVLLLATTNKMCQDVAVIPFLWVLPLALYLLSFIIAFDSPRWYVRPPFALALVAGLAGVTWAMFEGTDAKLLTQVALYSGGLFAFCMVCHGELFRLRPHPTRLTGFYLTISAGGAMGGLFVGLVAPLLFNDYLELHWGLAGCAALFTLVCFRDKLVSESNAGRWLAGAATLAGMVGLDYLVRWLQDKYGINGIAWVNEKFGLSGRHWVLAARISAAGLVLGVVVVLFVKGTLQAFRKWRWVTLVWMISGTVALVYALKTQAVLEGKAAVSRSRNFYGTLAVTEHSKDDASGHHFILQHGRITHGLQFVDPDKAVVPTSYYGHESGIGRALDAFTNRVRHVGVIGLGTGSIASHALPGDRFRIYEINEQVRELATSRFTYLKDATARGAKVDVVMGDARLSMEREVPQDFDVLVLDAFSSDAIPVHLLTKEAIELYGRHMNSNGVIVVHISNRYLDLEPVVLNVAKEFGYGAATIEFDYEVKDDKSEETAWWFYSSTWVLLSKDKELLARPSIHEPAAKHKPSTRKIPLWTDDFAGLFEILTDEFTGLFKILKQGEGG